LAAIYARVSTDRQRDEGTVESQVSELRELATERGLLVAEEFVFCDEGFSGAVLARPALERLRDRAAEGAFEPLLCHSADRLARRYAYQVLLLEELQRAGVEVAFAREPERTGSPEDELLRQFQGMIAEYERAQIAERMRRGRLHRARQGSQAVLAGAPYGYRYVRKSEHADAYYEVDEAEAQVVREVFRRYTEEGESMNRIARALTERGIPTRTGKAVWDQGAIGRMLRNPAYRGEAAYGKSRNQGRPAKATRPARARGERHGRRPARRVAPPEEWTLVPVPALVTAERFELAQARRAENKRFAARNTKRPSLLQGMLVCRECGYACHRHTSGSGHSYYRCTGSDGWLFPGGRVCQSRPVRADALDELVWGEVVRLLSNPELVRTEIERRLAAARTEHPAAQRREGIERELARTRGATERLISAYQEELLSLEELRSRTPELRRREAALASQLRSLDAELHDAETYLQLADTLEGFLSRLGERAATLDIGERQRVLRLVVREVLIGGEDGPVTIRHSIPLPQADDGGASSLLRDSLTALPLGPHHPETGPIAAHARPREAPPIVQRSAAGLPAARAPARSASPTARLRGPAPHQRWVRFQPEQMGAFSTGLDSRAFSSPLS
jgi:site-specific DNA recombinase